MKNQIMSNIWKIYLFRFLISFNLIAPILVPFYLSLDFTATQIFALSAIAMASNLLFEIPSGYLSDKFGRKKTLILCGIAYTIGSVIYAFFSKFYLFVLAQIIFGIGGSLLSGTDTSLIYDSLTQVKKINLFKKIEGGSRFFIRIAASSASFLGGLLALITLRTPFYFAAIVPMIMIPLAFSMMEPKRKKRKTETNALFDIGKISKFVFRHKKIMSITLYNALVCGIMLMIITSYYLYYNEIGFNATHISIIYGFFMIFSAFGAVSTHFLEKKIGKRNSFILLAFPFIIFILLGIFQSIYLIPFIFLNGFIWGFSRPLFSGYTNELISSEIRATALSVTNMVKVLPIIILSPLIGKLIDLTSLSISFYLIGGIYLVVSLISLYLLNKHKMI
ncbi:MAG: MFS transporter [Nanoarchaeota archaeon]|nr:MFS transporter [Nanoarchaeota archaeon]